jgi:hypothetical protein
MARAFLEVPVEPRLQTASGFGPPAKAWALIDTAFPMALQQKNEAR